MAEKRPVVRAALAHGPTGELFRRARVDGVEFDIVADGNIPSNRIYSMLAEEHAWDVGEQAFSTFLMCRDLGSTDMALPLFPARIVPHAGVFVHEDSGIKGPHDLVGKRVGCNSFGTNYSVWWRGILAHQYDVPAQRITWVQSVPEHRSDYQPPQRYPIEIMEGGTRSEELLAQGRIDAATTAGAGQRSRSPAVRPLFADWYVELRDFVARFGFVPVNTVITIRREAIEANPALPRLLQDALLAADPRRSVDGHAGGAHLYQRLEREIGRPLTGNGLAANLTCIQTMIAYCHEQGIIRRVYAPEEIFLLPDS